MKLLLAAAALGLLLTSPRFALACTCTETPTACAAFAGATAVFVGSVTRVRNKMAKDEDRNEFISQVANVKVEEAFKGVKTPKLVFRTYGTSVRCQLSEGRFKLSILEGSKGTLHGYLYSSSRDSANCSQINKLVKAHQDIETKRIKVEAIRDDQDLEVVFPFPYCAKGKEPRD